jgi:predicted esterase
MKRSVAYVAAVLGLLAPAGTRAQAPATPADGFEMYWRTRAMEAVFEEHTDAETRNRATAPLQTVLKTALSPKRMNLAEQFDQVRFAMLYPKGPEPDVVWGASLCVRPATRLLEVGADSLPVRVTAFYEVKAAVPKEAVLRLTLFAEGGKKKLHTQEANIDKVPLECSLSLKNLAKLGEGDFMLRSEIHSGAKLLFTVDQTVSLVAQPGERLARLTKAIDTLPDASIERESARNLATVLASMLKKELQTHSYDTVRLLAEAEAAIAARIAGKDYYHGERPGFFWLGVPADKATVFTRLFIPESARKGQPVPVVFALHGLGGNEDQFFEMYHRKVVKLCQDRGWMLVATRGSTGAGGGPPLPALIDALARRYPVDRQRIFVIGHSMGAAQAVALASATPERYAAVAPMGGGGQVKASDALKDLPFFVGVGSADILLAGARALNTSLKNAGVKKLEFREYKDIEHIMIVQVAAVDVFAFFDEVAKNPRKA